MRKLRKRSFALAITVVALLLAPYFANASAISIITAWTDQPFYSPGQKGTLNIDYYNARTEAIEIKNITVVYTAWNAYIGGSWVGNQTYNYTGLTLASNGINVFSDITFTVPTDGRVAGGGTSVQISVVSDHGTDTGSAFIQVATTPPYFGQLNTIFTIQVVLTIIGALVIAAAIFLTAHRPSVMWKSEPPK